VISRTSVAQYKGQNVDVRAVGQALHSAFVMTSSVRPLENKLMATVELSHADTGAVAFSREYVINGSDFRPAKAVIANDVVKALGLDPETAGSHRGTSSAAAYSAFLEGMGAVQSGAPADLHRGISSFEEAVRLDPEFSLVWAQMAEAHTLLGIYFEAPTEQMPVARHEAEQALKLDPTLASPHGTLGLINLLYDWNVSAANSQLAAARSQENAFGVLSCTAHLLHEAGKSSRAEDLVRRMEADNPQSAVIISELGCIAYYRGDYQEAIDHYHEALKMDVQSPVPYWGLGKSLSQQGKFREAVEAVSAFKEQNGFEPPLLTAEAGYALGREHKVADANQRISLLRSESRKNFVDPYLIAVIYLGLGEREETFDWLAKALDAKSPFLISILTDPKWESLRSDPRFLNILSQMHIS
jgi:tetratricopeptide (TPR) repeat protein